MGIVLGFGVLPKELFPGWTGAGIKEAEASALKSMSLYPQATALSADPMFQWSASVTRTDSTGTHHASAVAIAPDVFITAGHVTPRDDSTTAFLTELVFGDNYNTSTTRYAIDHTQRYPGFVFGDTSTIDLGVGWTTDFIDGFDTPVSFASASLGEVLTLCDYGNIGDPTTGEMPSLGDRMAGYAPKVDWSGIYPYPDNRFDFMAFNIGASSGITLNVQGLTGSSGSPWFNSGGSLTHLSIAATNGTLGGVTISLELNNPEVQAYLQPIIQDSWDRYYASLEQCQPGDMNHDDVVDGNDIQPFVQCMMGGGESCDCADMNDDAMLTQDDTTEFVSLLLNGG